MRATSPYLETKLLKSWHRFWAAVDRGWKGNDYGLAIIDRLNGDSLMNQPALTGVEIREHPRHGCFMVTHQNMTVTKEMWDLYQAIAAHILESVKYDL